MTVARPGAAARARLLIAVLAAALLGCSHHSNSPPGTQVLSISSTGHNFSAYIVTLTSLTLTRSDGTTFSPLINPQVVDLVRTEDVAELVEAPAVPSGTYTSASLTIDYTTANIWANVNGQPVAVVPRDKTGAAFTSTVLTLTFDPAQPLTITAGQSVRDQLQLDLEAFNTLNIVGTTSQVLVRGFAVLTPEVVDRTPLRARGLFVTTQSGTFVMNMRPFHDLVSALGALTVNVGAQTYYNVNGVAYTGAAGLAALGALPENTPMAAFGTMGSLSGITPSFNATAVYAGTSLENTSEDHIQGVVSARTGNTLTVLGADLLSGLGGVSFFKTATVNVGSNTIVSEDGNAAGPTSLAAVSVGQRIDVSGTSTINATAGTLTMDATAGQLRLQSTRAWGTLVSATPVEATLDLLRLGGYGPAAFNFAGTAAGGGAVNPAAYTATTAAADQSGTAANTLLAVDGNVAPFGAAPPDFIGSAVTPGSATRQQLVVEWSATLAGSPFTSMSANGLIVDLNNPALSGVRTIYTGPAGLDLKTLPASPLITTAGAQGGLNLAIGASTLTSGISVFHTVAAFDTALAAALNGGTHKVYRLVAVGSYQSVNNTFVADTIDVALQP
ncbi:MAG: hypothetical protein JOZ67_12075 [Gammaproteobacteria bacterium]|nr:hypothetical protein [Gammaproteobacteria bacterium]MBV9696611.1 hypothetical protein [Gammaproteobacteria bacterium]